MRHCYFYYSLYMVVIQVSAAAAPLPPIIIIIIIMLLITTTSSSTNLVFPGPDCCYTHFGQRVQQLKYYEYSDHLQCLENNNGKKNIYSYYKSLVILHVSNFVHKMKANFVKFVFFLSFFPIPARIILF